MRLLTIKKMIQFGQICQESNDRKIERQAEAALRMHPFQCSIIVAAKTTAEKERAFTAAFLRRLKCWDLI
jgi:hypothetical protein